MGCRTPPPRSFPRILAAVVLFGPCVLARGGPEKARNGPPPESGPFRERIDQILKDLETDLLLIQPGAASSGGVHFGSGTAAALTPADAEAIARECRPVVSAAAPVVRARPRVVYRTKAWVPLYLYGTTPSFLDARGWGVERGRRFTDREAEDGAGVCLLGQTLAHELFGKGDPLNRVVRVHGHPLKVVGVLSRKGANLMGLDRDDVLLAPWRTVRDKVSGPAGAGARRDAKGSPTDAAKEAHSLKNLYPQPAPNQASVVAPGVDQIVVKVAGEKAIPDATRKIAALLRKRHHIAAGAPDDFTIRDMSEMARALRSARERLQGKEPRKDDSRK